MNQDKVKTGVSYFGNRNPKHFVHDAQDIVAHNCSFVLHTYSENDQQFYKDTIADLVRMSKDVGLQCYLDPWGIGRVFGGETYSSFALKNLDTLQVLPDGEIAPAVCFNHPKFRAFMDDWISDAADIGADVLFWDEPHFFLNLKEKERFDIWHCRCKSCRERFDGKFGKTMEAASRDEILRFRDDSVVNFLDDLCITAHKLGMQNAICLLPFMDERLGLSDWARVVALQSVDIFGTDPYWMFFNEDLQKFVRGYSAEVTRLGKQYNKEGQIWIQAYKIYAGREEELRTAIEIAYAEGIRNFAAWSYAGNAYMSYNRSENPEKVWEVIAGAYKWLRSK